jgi:iron complex outermembrane receptor protein
MFLLNLSVSAPDKILIEGNISDSTGSPLIGANVLILNSVYGGSTNENGYYSIKIPNTETGKQVTLEVRYVGYISQTKTITITSDIITQNFQLDVDVLSLKSVVVSAQRIEENLQEVPISITAIDKPAILQSGADRLAELQYYVPNLVFAYEYFTFLSVASIRGISGSSGNIGRENRTGIYIDGAYAGRSITLDQNLYDIERVEVLRGPQGTMFGKNAISGVINLTTLKPHNRLESALMVEGANYNHFRVNFFLNLPLIQNRLLAKVSANTFFRDGYINNVYSEQDLNGINTLGGRLQLRYFASDDLEFNLSIDGVRDRQDNRTILIETEGEGFELAPGPREVAHDADEFQHRDLLSSALKIDYNFPNNLSFKSISSYNWYKAQSRFDEDLSPSSFLYSDRDEESQHFTQEFQIATSFGKKTNFVAGLFYFHQKSETETNVTFDSDSPFGYYYIVTPGSVKTNQFAGYFHGNINLTDNLILTAGLRYTYEEKKLNFSQYNDPEPYMFPDIDNLIDDLSETDFSPKGGLNLFLNRNVMLYGMVARAFKSGGWNANFTKTENIKFGPEYSTNFEIGIKTTLLNNRFRFNAAAFYNRINDYQVLTWIGTTLDDLIMVVKNAGKVTTKGFELELSAVPMLGLNLSTGFGYTDAKYDEFKNGGGLGIHYDGHTLPWAPNINFNIAADYRFQTGSLGSLILHCDFAYQDDMYSFSSNEDFDYLAAYSLINARIGFEFLNIPLSFALWGKNLTDELYMRDRGPAPVGTVGTWYGMPRTYGIELRYSFLR